MTNKEAAYKKISELVDRFSDQYDSYKKSDYNETLTRRDFIDPFFKALGWDIDNENGYAESYREVIHEDKVKVGKATKAPDYSFRLVGGKRLFFVEAKKPSVFVKDEIQPAYQVRRYGWSAKLPISIITDFEEFSVYDCTQKPKPTDKASNARIKYLTFKEYLTEFDFLWDTFSKERVLKGSFDKFVQSDTHKKGTATVDKEFLLSLDSWRTYLATSVSWNNKNLSEEEINFAVQQTINRIIFLRIAEDRSIEPYGNLMDAVRQGNYFQNLFRLFLKADDKYNSGLFDARRDKISKNLVIDNKVIRNIIHELYYPESPYEFSVLSVEILGNAYERFLGKVIRITPAHHAKIEEKPEIRKAGGVYYTPQYIVDFIVKNTVGKVIEGKTPQMVNKVKILDPACGSGSFLLGAYQYLLDWHRGVYQEKLVHSKGLKEHPLTPDGNLTTAEKKRILLNNIYGVDLDSNAVEVTKLSLLLKCMEGETDASIETLLRLFHEPVLPSLENNIKCGNSLIDVDYYAGELDFGEERIIKPFNWQRAFPNVFKIAKQGENLDFKRQFLKVKNMSNETDDLLDKYQAREPESLYKNIGFDVVIGNPPYVRQELLGTQKIYFQNKYRVYHGMADLYSYFIERSIQLLKPDGIYGVIVANKWMRTNYGEPLRIFLRQQNLLEIIDFGDLPVFQEATTYPCILILTKSEKQSPQFRLTVPKTLDFSSLTEYVETHYSFRGKEILESIGWNLGDEDENNLLKKLQATGVPLENYTQGKIFRGIITGLNEAFVINEETKSRLIREDSRSAEIIKPFLAGRDIKMYQQPIVYKHLIFIPKGFTKSKIGSTKYAWRWIKDKYPAIASFLESYKTRAEKRFDKGDFWWELRACEYYGEFEKPKIIYPNILKKPEFTFDENGYYTNQKCFIIPMADKYLLGLLNSRLFHFLMMKYLPKLRGGFYEPSYVIFKNFPVKVINPSDTGEVKCKEEIIAYADQLIALKKECRDTSLRSKKEQVEQRINFIESQANRCIFQLYQLTETEIKIIEEKVMSNE